MQLPTMNRLTALKKRDSHYLKQLMNVIPVNNIDQYLRKHTHLLR